MFKERICKVWSQLKFRGCKVNVFSISSLVICLFFYLFFAVYDGAIICVDSPSYIGMYLSREPLYPIFLAILRSAFASMGDFYLTIAVLIQSVLAALATWSLVNFLKKELKVSIIVSYFMMLLPLLTSLLCRFAAKRSSMYSNSILTEGLTCSLFLLFFRYLLEYCFHRTMKGLVLANFLAFILVSLRKQMYFAVVLLAVSIIAIYFKSSVKKGIFTCLICLCSILPANLALDYGYNYYVHGLLGTHSSDNRFLATMIFYTAEEEDADYIEDRGLSELFKSIYVICEENGYTGHDLDKGWYDRVEHFGNNYDRIQIDTMWPMIQEYVHENYHGNAMTLEKKVDELTNKIIVDVFPAVWFKLLSIFMDNFWSGFVMTVAQLRVSLVFYTAIIYLAYFVLLVRNIKRDGFSKLSVLGIVTMLSVVINVVIVSAVIFCQVRYMIYNMPLFYISGLLLLEHNVATMFSENAGNPCRNSSRRPR